MSSGARSLKGQVSDLEWAMRADLAACVIHTHTLAGVEEAVARMDGQTTGGWSSMPS